MGAKSAMDKERRKLMRTSQNAPVSGSLSFLWYMVIFLKMEDYKGYAKFGGWKKRKLVKFPVAI